MGLSFTYNSLVTTIGQYTLEGTSAVSAGVVLNNGDFQAALPVIINLAEERIIRAINTNVFDVEINGLLSEANPYLAIPDGYLGIRYLQVSYDGNSYIPMRRHDITWLENYWRNSSNVAEPLYYAVWGNNDSEGPYSGSFKLAPTPDFAYNYRLRYIQRPETISTTNATTWLSLNAADCLLWSCLAQSMAYFA